MNNKNPSPEEIKQKREFAYRAYSPDSEPPSPRQESEAQEAEEVSPGGENKRSRESGRQSA